MPSTTAGEARKQNIIDMSLGFTAMMRIFDEGSKAKIAKQFANFCEQLVHANSEKEYATLHHSFCAWFSENIRTAEKHFKKRPKKASAAASYGHGAKVLDIAVKVYVHYCSLPDAAIAKRLVPFLHGAIDTPILDYLKASFPQCEVSASTIEGIDEAQYYALQKLIRDDIKNQFNGSVTPVEYDDIMWKELNRS